MKLNHILFTAGVVGAFCLAACGDEPEPNTAYNAGTTGYYGYTSSATYGATTGGYTQQTTTTTGGGTSSTASPVPPAIAAAMSPVIRGSATAETNGMNEDGPTFGANLQTGQTYEQPIQIQPGKCYTVVGLSPMGVTELDVELVLHQPPAPEYVAAADSTTGPQAILGGAPNCFKNPLPIGAPGKVRVRATQGAGVAFVQVYSR